MTWEALLVIKSGSLGPDVHVSHVIAVPESVTLELLFFSWSCLGFLQCAALPVDGELLLLSMIGNP